MLNSMSSCDRGSNYKSKATENNSNSHKQHSQKKRRKKKKKEKRTINQYGFGIPFFYSYDEHDDGNGSVDDWRFSVILGMILMLFFF